MPSDNYLLTPRKSPSLSFSFGLLWEGVTCSKASVSGSPSVMVQLSSVHFSHW